MMGPKACNKASTAAQGKQEGLNLIGNSKTEICHFELVDPSGGASPIGIYYEVVTAPTTPAGAIDPNTAIEVTIEWGYGQARWQRVFFVANWAAGTGVLSAPNQGKATVFGNWARVSARLQPANLADVPVTGVTATFGAQVGPATPENSDHLTAWGFTNSTQSAGASGQIALNINPASVLQLTQVQATLWRMFIQNYGNVGFWVFLIDQVGTAIPAPGIPNLELGFVAPNGVSSFDALLSGKGFTNGILFVPSSTGDNLTPIPAAKARLDYEILVL